MTETAGRIYVLMLFVGITAVPVGLSLIPALGVSVGATLAAVGLLAVAIGQLNVETPTDVALRELVASHS